MLRIAGLTLPLGLLSLSCVHPDYLSITHAQSSESHILSSILDHTVSMGLFSTMLPTPGILWPLCSLGKARIVISIPSAQA